MRVDEFSNYFIRPAPEVYPEGGRRCPHGWLDVMDDCEICRELVLRWIQEELVPLLRCIASIRLPFPDGGPMFSVVIRTGRNSSIALRHERWDEERDNAEDEDEEDSAYAERDESDPWLLTIEPRLEGSMTTPTT